MDQFSHPKIMSFDLSEKDPFRRLCNYVQLQISSDKPKLRVEDRFEVREMLHGVKASSEDISILINKILVLQKYCHLELQSFLRNIVIYELESILADQVVNETSRQKQASELMKKKPCLAKTLKPGKRSKFL
jgi:hypothetical protein